MEDTKKFKKIGFKTLGNQLGRLIQNPIHPPSLYKEGGVIQMPDVSFQYVEKLIIPGLRHPPGGFFGISH